ncbi:MAG: ribosomal-processing cysteine protease Prp [Clostridia bacterium]|nr:ribosomal-processing cysteine protease Prp [Clostridia bacterium]
MIKIVFFHYDNGELVGFRASGHAGYSEPGKDIVCAAASILATTAVNSLEELISIKPVYNVDEESGFLECFIPHELSGSDFIKAQTILKTTEIGLRSLEQEYGRYIKITQRRWTKC